MNGEDYKYYAFISYSHADSGWADWLHRSLEKFVIPKSLRKETNFTLPKTLYPIFKDREELPSAAKLGDHITRALTASRYLIVICSPDAAQSDWVNQEVCIFKALGREDRVLCLIVDGEPAASETSSQSSGRGTHPLRRASDAEKAMMRRATTNTVMSNESQKNAGQECFPPAVRYSVGADRQILPERSEPIAADAREGKDGKNLALLKLIAGLLNIDLFQLTQRQHQRRINRLKLLTALMLALVTAFASIAFTAWKAQQEAEALSLVALSRQLSTHANSLFDSDKSLRVSMLLAGVQAHSFAPTVEASSATLKTLLATRSIKSVLSAESAVMNIAYSPDGNWLAAAMDNGDVLLWNLLTMTRSRDPLVGHEGSVLTLAFSPDGTSLVSGGIDESVIVWKLHTDSPGTPPTSTALAAHNDWVVGVDFAPDGTSFVTSGWDGRAIIWDAFSLQPITELPLSPRGWASSVEFSANGAWLAIGREDGSVEIWDVAARALSDPILKGHLGWVTDVSFSHDTRYLATASSDGSMRVWDLEKKTLRYDVASGAGLGITSAIFSLNDEVLITGGWDRKINKWKVKTGEKLGEPLLGHTEQVTNVAMAPDGKTFSTAGHDGSIVIWDINPGYPHRQHYCSQRSPINSIGFGQNGSMIVTASINNEVMLCGVNHQIEPHRIAGSMSKYLALSRDGRRLAFIDNEHEIVQYDIGDLAPVADPINLYPSVISSLAYSPDNRFIAVGDRNANVHLWQRDPAVHLTTLVGHQGPILDLDFSADGRTLASASEDAQIFLWDINDGAAKQSGILRGNSTPVTTIAFQPDASHVLASGNEEGVLTFWNSALAEPIGAPITAHDGAINTLAFSMDGALVATGGSDRRISLRDSQSRKQIGPKLTAHTDQVTTLSFSPHEYTLVSGSADGRIMVWDLDISNWKKSICQKVAQQLTDQEWELYIGGLVPYKNACSATEEHLE